MRAHPCAHPPTASGTSTALMVAYAGEAAGSKLTKAESLGVAVLSEAQLNALIKP